VRTFSQPFFCLLVVVSALDQFDDGAAAQEKTESKSRRSVTTTEWPSLRGVLAVEDVRRSLELNDDEQEKVRLFVRNDRRGRPAFNPSDDDTTANPPEHAWQGELRQQERWLKVIVGAERYARIRQLQAQAGGLPGAFTRDEPSDRLGITGEQRNQARKEIRAAAEQMTDRFHAVAPGDFTENARARSELYEKLAPALTALLTEEQKVKWAEMVGEPADEELILKIRTLGGR
jgi:hypothetical protein